MAASTIFKYLRTYHVDSVLHFQRFNSSKVSGKGMLNVT